MKQKKKDRIKFYQVMTIALSRLLIRAVAVSQSCIFMCLNHVSKNKLPEQLAIAFFAVFQTIQL